jgi:hypothetical protein
VLLPLGCENLGTEKRPYYHGGGLLPVIINWQTEVLTQGIFAPMHNWVLRCLTVEEVLVAKDFNKVLADFLTLGPLTNRFLQNFTPGKSLIGLAH